MEGSTQQFLFNERIGELVPNPQRPLFGQTMLVVDPSRYGCEMVRLLAQGSGVRLRRAGSVAAAKRHLRTYRPTIALIDLCLFDGSGLDLIGELAELSHRPCVIFAVSGREDDAKAVKHSGADGFIHKPLRNKASFQHTILAALPDASRCRGPRVVSFSEVEPDQAAFLEDLQAGITLLNDSPEQVHQVGRFISELAIGIRDQALQARLEALDLNGPCDMAALRLLGALEQHIADRSAA